MKTPATPVSASANRVEPPEIATVLRWVRSRTDAEPVPEEWVPGATPSERTQLGALGELSGALLRSSGASIQDFGSPALQRWVRPSVRPTDGATGALQDLLSTNPEQNLAGIYSAIVSGASRRTLGTFFTPAGEADWMVRAWKRQFPSPTSVIDVGAGVGIFSLRAAAAWPHATIFAVDVNPVTLGLLAMCDFSRSTTPSPGTGQVLPVEADFTRWLDEEWGGIPGPRLILGNPPYTRVQLLPAADRKRLTLAGAGLVGSRATLSAIITAQALISLGPADGLALLLPAQWLEADYAKDLRSYLWNQTRRRVALHVFEEQLFADATVDAVALLVGPLQGDPQPLTVDGTDATQTVDRREISDGRELDRVVARARFRAGTSNHSSSEDVSLSSFVRVRRGVATGANWFFILDEASIEKHKLSPEVLTPMVRRTKSAPDVFTEAAFAEMPTTDRRWLLTANYGQQFINPALRQYIAQGEAREANHALLCTRRKCWFDLHHDLSIPDLIIGQSSKSGFRIVDNELGAAISNNLYGMRWLPATTEPQRESIVAWLRGASGQTALRGAARIHATGLLKIEPRALSELKLPRAAWDPGAMGPMIGRAKASKEG